MRRFTLTLATSVAALALLPAGALAAIHARHHQRRHHHVHHVSVRHERFGCEMADGNEINNMHADGERGSGHGGGDNSGPVRSGDQGSPGGDNGGRGGDDGDRGGDDGDRGDDNGNDNQNCMAADLVAGAVVRSAELRISSAGATWDKVELSG